MQKPVTSNISYEENVRYQLTVFRVQQDLFLGAECFPAGFIQIFLSTACPHASMIRWNIFQ